MSTHDRGTFGQLLAEAKALGRSGLLFTVDFQRADDDEERWYASAPSTPDRHASAHGRTGEEALRRLVEKLRPVV